MIMPLKKGLKYGKKFLVLNKSVHFYTTEMALFPVLSRIHGRVEVAEKTIFSS
jgi:hypothetical protein